jgi:hypothetical protein
VLAPRGQLPDIVLCRHVREHLEDPLAALRAMRALLAPGGELRVIVPRERHRWSAFEPDLNQHLYCWNFRALNNLLAGAGYEVRSNRYVYARGYGVLLPVRHWLGRRPYQLGARVCGRLARAGELLAAATISP